MQGFVPTLLEDVPDMAVKFAVYESLRRTYQRITGKQVCGWCMGHIKLLECGWCLGHIGLVECG